MAMATYNGERFLQEQLDSLARQTLLPFELIVCDDGSMDGTLDILHRFAAKAPFPVQIHRNPERLGCGENFLQAVGLCEGDLVAFSDQDDVWLPEKLAVCAQALEVDGATMVVHLANLVDEGLKPKGRTWPSQSRRWAGWWNSYELLERKGMAGAVMVFRRSAAEPLLADPNLHRAFAGHDDAMGFVAGAAGRVISLRQVLGLHRCHASNSSKSHEAAADSAVAYVLGARGARGRLAAATTWMRTHADLAKGTGWGDYAREAESLRSRAKVLGEAATHAEGRLRAMLERSSHVLSRRAEAFGERSALYQDAAGRARPRFFRMVVGGSYGRRNRGGLGLWSLAKDCLVALRFSRGQSPTVAEGKPGGRADPVERGKQLIDAPAKRGGS